MPIVAIKLDQRSKIRLLSSYYLSIQSQFIWFPGSLHLKAACRSEGVSQTAINAQICNQIPLIMQSFTSRQPGKEGKAATAGMCMTMHSGFLCYKHIMHRSCWVKMDAGGWSCLAQLKSVRRWREDGEGRAMQGIVDSRRWTPGLISMFLIREMQKLWCITSVRTEIWASNFHEKPSFQRTILLCVLWC